MKNGRKRIIALLMAAFMMFTLCLAGCGNKEDEKVKDGKIEVTDLLGRTVEVPADSKSYACLGPGCLRLYSYVADTDQLAGVEDAEISWPDAGRPYTLALGTKEERAKRKVIGAGGPKNTADAEALVEAGPDVIFTKYASDKAEVDELQKKTGIPVLAISYGDETIFNDEIYKSLEMIGKVTRNEDRAKEMVNYLKSTKKDLEKRTKDVKNKPSVYLGGMSFKGSHGIESTAGDYAIFKALGADNVIDKTGAKNHVMIDKEEIINMDPDYIIIDAGGLQIIKDDYKKNPEFYNSLEAFKKGNVYLEMPFNFYYTNIDTAMADMYYVGKVLYPEQFKDINPEKKFNEITKKMLGIECYDQIAKAYHGGYQQITLESLGK